MTATPLLSVTDLRIARFNGAEIVSGVNLSAGIGQTLGIAGESGCGKSTLLLAMLGITKPGLGKSSGQVVFDGRDLFTADEESLRTIRGGSLALIPQSAGNALTPSMRIGQQIDEVLRFHTSLDTDARQTCIVELLGKVRLPNPQSLVDRYPHQFSGGQLQRIAIAMALAGSPRMLLLDEPTTGLDVTTQLGILDLLNDIRRSNNMAMICVSHDLGVLSQLCDRMAVMYAGAVIEEGPTAALLSSPKHPYTAALLASVPRLDSPNMPGTIPGRPPRGQEQLHGCRFAPRCASARQKCSNSDPELAAFSEGYKVACHFAGQVTSQESGGPIARERGGSDSIMLELEQLSVSYAKARHWPFSALSKAPRNTVHKVSFALRKGEILGLVGESGSGKSTILKAVSGLWPKAGGVMRVGTPPQTIRSDDPTPLPMRRIIQLVFQNPDSSLNPRHTIEEILAQPLRLYFGANAAEVKEKAAALLTDVRLDPSFLARYPGQLSGGERQRVAIARAFAAEPEILLCDEVTSALDVSVQAQVIGLLSELSQKRGVTTVLVSHDLAIVRALCDRIAVLYRGELVEVGPAEELCRNPQHPYTRALIGSVLEPGITHAQRRPLARDEDDVTSSGCPFAGRCLERVDACTITMPEWSGGVHRVRCHLMLPVASHSVPARHKRAVS